MVKMNKKAQADAVNIIAGLIVIAGGIAVALNYVNLGLLLSGLGAVIEAIKIISIGGLK
jgi:hypothetical protein